MLIQLGGRSGSSISGHAIVDDCDSDLSERNWCRTRGGYACRRSGICHVLMHRVVLARSLERELSGGEVVDHINGDRLDNRRCNLRLATPQINAQNRRLGPSNTSGYRGVSWNRQHRKWQAMVKHNRVQFNCGEYATRELAAKAASKARERFGFATGAV